jgi:peptide/nickel transport system substrate-binding protein
MNWRTLAAMLVAAIGVGAAGVSAVHAADPAPSTLHLYVPLDPHTLNPLLTTEADEHAIAGLMFDPLVRYDGRNQPVPALAAVIPTRANGGISADGKLITMHLRRDVRWQDGAPFTSADVVFTIHAILDDRNNVINRDDYAKIASVDAPDRSTVRFHLKQPQASFLANVAGGYQIVPEHLLGKSADLATDPFDAQPVGTGAYRFVRWLRGDRVELEANPTYALGAPKIARLSVDIVPDTNTLGIELRQHHIDYAVVESSVYNELAGVAGLRRIREPRNVINMLAINHERPIMRDLAVREAVVKAIDRKRLVETLTHGVGIVAYGDLPLFMYDGHPPAGWDAADPAGARALLDRAGWKMGADGIRVKNGTPLRLQYIDYGGSTSGASLDAQVIQMLRAVGIDVSYKTYATSMYFQPASANGPVDSGQFDIAGMGFLGSNDPANDAIYSCAARAPRGNNAARYCSPEMDRLLAASQREYDWNRRKRIVAQIEALAVRDVVYVPLYHTPYRIIEIPALKHPPVGLTDQWYGIQDWTIETPSAAAGSKGTI